MARYNTVQVAGSLSTATTLAAPTQGLFTEFVGTPPYTVTVPNPTIYYGQTNSYFNNTGGQITLQTPSGVFNGPGGSGANTLIMYPNSSITLASDQTNYIVVSFPHGNQFGYSYTTRGDIIADTLYTTTYNVLNTGATTLNIGGAATSVNIGASTGTTTINNSLYVKGGVVTVNSSSVLVEDKNIELAYVNPISYGGGTITGYTGVLTGSTTFGSITGTKVTAAATYSNVSQTSTSGVGSGATFNVTTTGSGTTYTGVTTITLVTGGSGYAIGDTVTLPGSSLGGTTSPNNLTFTIGTAVGSPFVSTITGIANTTNLVSGEAVSATNGTGSLGSGGTQYYVSNVLTGTSIQVTSVGGTAPTAGTITNITPGSADLFANGGGIKLYGTSTHSFLWNQTSNGPLNGNQTPAWTSSEGLMFSGTNAGNHGIQSTGNINFNILTNSQATGTVNIATNAVTGNLFTAATTTNIGLAGGTMTLNATTLTVASATTVNMNSATAVNAGSAFGYFSSLGVGTNTNPGGGQIYATSNITAYYSDDRLKTRLGNIENALEKLETLTGFYYEANETAQALGYEPVREVGVSAQDVQKILPEIVKPAPIDAKYMTIHYEKLIPLVIEAVKELSAEVKAIKSQINKD